MWAPLSLLGLGLALGLGLTACYAPSPSVGMPCAPASTGEEACPRGQTCSPDGLCLRPEDIGMTPDGGGEVDAPSDDLDQDGVKNAADNCPQVANLDQANDDLDAFGDACDPCPPFPDGSVAIDPDGDGVSGLCDPYPMTGGDRIALFESFRGAALPAGWVALGTWSFVAGNAVVTSGDGELHYLTIARPHLAKTSVLTQMTVDELVGNGARGLGPAQQYQPSPSRSITCELLRNGNGPKLTLIDTGGAGATLGDVDGTFDVGTTVLLSSRRTGTAYECGNGTDTVPGTTTYTTTIPSLGLRAKSASARFAWVLVVE